MSRAGEKVIQDDASASVADVGELHDIIREALDSIFDAIEDPHTRAFLAIPLLDARRAVLSLWLCAESLNDDEAISRGVRAVNKMGMLRVGDRHDRAEAFRAAIALTMPRSVVE